MREKAGLDRRVGSSCREGQGLGSNEDNGVIGEDDCRGTRDPWYRVPAASLCERESRDLLLLQQSANLLLASRRGSDAFLFGNRRIQGGKKATKETYIQRA